MPADQPLYPLLRMPTLRREGERDRRISEAEPMTANPFRVDALDVATGHPIEVLPGVYEVRESLAPAFDTPECWVSLFILTDPTGHARPAIIDTGVPRSTDTVILPALAALGFAPSDLEVAVCSHSHHDHAGSNVQLRDATGCAIWIGRRDGPALLRGDRFGDDVIPPHEADRLLDGGETITLAGRTYEVVDLPGHSPGSIGLYDRERHVFFTGDALQARGTTTQGVPGAADRPSYRRSIAATRALTIEHLFPAHPYLPFPSSHVTPATEVTRYLDTCLDAIDSIDPRILDALRHEGGSATIDAIARQVCAEFAVVPVLAAPILGGYLAQLAEAGHVRRDGDHWVVA